MTSNKRTHTRKKLPEFDQNEAFSPSPEISTAGLTLYKGKLTHFDSEENQTFYKSHLNPDLKLLQREGQILSVLSAVVGNAAGTAGEAAKSTEDHEIPAHLTTFDLGGKLFFSGYVGFAPFQEGDEVEVVAGPDIKDHWRKVFAIRRVSDGLITTMPLCTSGRHGYYWDMFAGYSVVLGCLLFVVLISWLVMPEGGYAGLIISFQVNGTLAIIFGLITLGMCTAYAENAPQHVIAEHIFGTFGWKDPHKIILRGPGRYKKQIAQLPMAAKFRQKAYWRHYNRDVFIYPREK